MKDRIKGWIFKKVYKYFGRTSFSQAGEDAVIDSLLWQVGLKSPSYLELGVCHPWHGNNTFKFYLRGATGVLVEADESQLGLISQARPKDKLLNVGVTFNGDKFGNFYVFQEKSINTFDKAEAELRQEQGHDILKVIQVPLQTINEIIEQNFATYPDLLSIDIEGMDFGVLSQLDFDRFPIPIICAETCLFSNSHIRERNSEINKLLESNGYFLYADTYLNGIFVNDKWFKNIKA